MSKETGFTLRRIKHPKPDSDPFYFQCNACRCVVQGDPYALIAWGNPHKCASKAA